MHTGGGGGSGSFNAGGGAVPGVPSLSLNHGGLSASTPFDTWSVAGGDVGRGGGGGGNQALSSSTKVKVKGMYCDTFRLGWCVAHVIIRTCGKCYILLYIHPLCFASRTDDVCAYCTCHVVPSYRFISEVIR